MHFFRSTSQVGPSGLCTFGRVALLPCAARGIATTATSTARHTAGLEFHFIRIVSRYRRLERQRLGARTEIASHPNLASACIVLREFVHPVLVENGQQHIGSSFGIVRVSDVAIPFERSVQPAQQDDWYLDMRMAMGIPHIAA